MAFDVSADPNGSRYTGDLGRAVCARVAAGESLRKIGAEADWPTPQTVWHWANAHPDFAEALSQAQKAARIASRLADRAREAARPGRRKAGPRGGPPSLYTPALTEEICRRLAEGESLTAIADEALEVTRGATAGTVWADRLRFDGIRWLTARLAPRKYCEKIMVVEAARAEAEPQGMTVIVKRYSDITPEDVPRRRHAAM